MPIDYEVNGSVAYLTLRNGTVNPITPAMHQELYDALQRFLADDQVSVGILTGAGDRAFSAGDDIKTPEPPPDSPLEGFMADVTPTHRVPPQPSFSWEREVARIERYKPIIGAVRGWCLGQGLVYLLQLTDIRVCSEDAKFGFPEIAYGMGGAGGLTQLGRYIPHTVAMQMLLTGRPIDAREANRISLVNAVVPAGDVLSWAMTMAEAISQHPPIAVRIEMEAYQRGMELSHDDALRFAEHLYRLQRMALGGNESVETFFRESDPD